MNLPSFSLTELYGAGITTALFLLLLPYCFVLYSLPRRKYREQNSVAEQQDDASLPPVSVIIYAQDDAERLRRHIPVFLTQEYPQPFEVIVVGDDISETSMDELSAFRKQYPQFYYTYIPKGARYISKKKLALTLGIKAAHYETVVFTEWDCEPTSNRWLRAMLSAYQAHTQMVIGFCSYPYNTGWRNRFIAFDNLKLGLQYISAGLLRKFYNGTGKNLSYTRSLFFANKGFYNQLYLKQGEDSLFINDAATPDNATICYSPDSLMLMDEKHNLRRWTLERITHTANQRLYKNKFYYVFKLEELLYWLYMGSSLILILLGLAGNGLLIAVTLLLLLIYYSVKSFLFRTSARLLGQRISHGCFFFLDVANHIYSLYIELVSHFNRKRNHVFTIHKASLL